jgi:hypothetical protein
MSFSLFGFDFLPEDSTYGFWIGGVKNWDYYHSSFFLVYYTDELWQVELLWFRVI